MKEFNVKTTDEWMTCDDLDTENVNCSDAKVRLA